MLIASMLLFLNVVLLTSHAGVIYYCDIGWSWWYIFSSKLEFEGFVSCLNCDACILYSVYKYICLGEDLLTLIQTSRHWIMLHLLHISICFLFQWFLKICTDIFFLLLESIFFLQTDIKRNRKKLVYIICF